MTALHLIITLLTSPVALAAVTHELDVTQTSEFSFFINGTQGARVTNDQGKLAVHTTASKQELAEVEAPMDSKLDVLIDDYNFDGFQDIAVETSVGYGGVNVFYDVFAYDPQAKSFKKVLSEISNPQTHAVLQTVECGMKSGPEWIRQVYSVAGGTLYLSSESTNRVGTGIERVVRTDERGRTLSVAIVDDEGQPVTKTIASDRAILHLRPRADDATKSYVIKGDKVVLKDFTSADDGTDWYLVEYAGKTTLTRWVQSDDIDWDEDQTSQE